MMIKKVNAMCDELNLEIEEAYSSNTNIQKLSCSESIENISNNEYIEGITILYDTYVDILENLSDEEDIILSDDE